MKEDYSYLDYLDFFTTPFHLSTNSEKDLLKKLPKNKYDRVIVVGRFQPIHYGHIYLLKQALYVANIITIGIGSVNVRNKDNPFTYDERFYMLKKVLIKQGLINRVQNIVPLKDISDDNKWIDATIAQTGQIDAIVGNNKWVNDCFNSVDIPSVQTPLLQRGMYEGTRIRKFLRDVGKL